MRRHDLIRLLAFVVLLVVVDRGLYAVLSAGFKRTQTGQTGGRVNRALEDESDIVILGSSRAQHHYVSSVLGEGLGPGVLNAGCEGQGIPYARALVDLILKRRSPRLFIINVDPAEFTVRVTEHYERISRLAPFIDESDVLRQMIYRRGPFERLKYVSKSYQFNSKPLAILANLGKEPDDDSGYDPVNHAFDPERAEDQVQDRFEATWRIDGYGVQLFVAMIEQSLAADTDVVLVRSPRWQDHLSFGPDHDQVVKLIEQIAYDHGVPLIQILQADHPEFQTADVFADYSHLNGRGAELFTRILVEELTRLGYADSNCRTPTKAPSEVTASQ